MEKIGMSEKENPLASIDGNSLNEKIKDDEISRKMTLVEVGEIALEVIQSYIHQGEKDIGWELSTISDKLQVVIILNFFDEVTMTVKLYPHKNNIRENVFRFEVFLTKAGEMRGTRIASVEIQAEKISRAEVSSFLGGILTRTGIKKPSNI